MVATLKEGQQASNFTGGGGGGAKAPHALP